MATHIGMALLENAQPTGQMKALCGAVVATALPKGTSQEGRQMCPTCVQINENERSAGTCH